MPGEETVYRLDGKRCRCGSCRNCRKQNVGGDIFIGILAAGAICKFTYIS